MLGKKKQLHEAAQKAWILGGVQAWKSLESEIQDNVKESGQIPLSDTSPSGSKRLLQMMRVQSADPVASVWGEVTAWMRADSTRSELEKRLMYRQAIIAAGLMTGNEEQVSECLDLEANSLHLETD